MTRAFRFSTLFPTVFPTVFPVIFPVIFTVVATLVSAPAFADGFSTRLAFSGTFDQSGAASLAQALGFQDRRSSAASARLMWDKNLGDFRLEAHALLAYSHGDNVAFASAMAPFVPASPPATLFDLSETLFNDTDTDLRGVIDRFSLTYTNENLVLRAGRQAITWGSGLVFHPSDIVAPFAPQAIDTAYKPGVDMVYGQYLFDTGADIQAIYVPRAAVAGGDVAWDASTLALRAQFQLGDFDSAIMLARDRGDSVASLGLSGALGGAAWNAEYIGWQLASGEYKPSWLLNLSNFGSLGAMNLSYFGEYFHNGFGADTGVRLDALPASLTKRMATGQVFLTGRDYLALAASLQMTADLTVSPNAILNLADGSALAGFSVDYVLGDNTNLVFSYAQPLGAVGTEFGGLETTVGSGVFAGPPSTASLQFVQYF